MKRVGYDSGLIGFLNRIADIISLNVAFLIACLPVVTYGPAKAALYACTVKWTKKEDAGFLTFFKELKSNLRSSFLPGLLMLALTVILYLDFIFSFMGEGTKATRIITVIAALLFFPYQEQLFLFSARFECRFVDLLRNTLIVSLSNPIGGLISALLMAAPFLIWMALPATFIQLTLVWLLGYFSVVAWVGAALMKKTHDKIIADHGQPSEDSDAEQ